MTSYLRPLSALCCSVAIISLANCGGNGTESEGLAPSNMRNCHLNVLIEGGVHGNLGVAMPPQFEIEFDDQARFTIIDRDTVLPMWHDKGLATYIKTGNGDTARLTLVFNSADAGDDGTTTAQLQIQMPNLTFRDEINAVSEQSSLIAIDAEKEITGEGTAKIVINFLKRNSVDSTN